MVVCLLLLLMNGLAWILKSVLWLISYYHNVVGYSTLFFFFSTLFEILPWENGFQLWVGCFPGSRSLKATSETSGLFSFKSLENSQRTAGNHLSMAIIRVNLEKKKNRLLFLIKGPFSTVYIATSNFSFLIVKKTKIFSQLWENNFCFLTTVRKQKFSSQLEN